MSEQQDSQGHDAQEIQRPLTYYDVLDLDRDATADEVKDAYFRLAREHHPDVASDDPDTAQKFAVINEAYRVLSDHQRRHQYDRTLPKKTYPLRHPTPQKVWREATEVVLIRSDRFGPLNQAMQATIPVTLDGDTLVLTLPGSERHLAGHLETAANRNSILNALELVRGQRTDLRVIDGTTTADWEALKGAEKSVRATAAKADAQRSAGIPVDRPGAVGDDPWSQLVQRMHRHYQQLPKRQYPQSKARFVREALGWISSTDEELRFAGEGDEDAHERALARSIERLAAIVDIPPVLIALQMDALKRAGEV